MLLMTSH